MSLATVSLLAAWAALLACPASGQVAARPGRWHDRLSTAVDEARATGKPLMVVFRCVR